MPEGIIIFGPAGSGKTTLGRMVAKELDFPYFDIDDYIWRKDTDRPFTVMYTREEKINRLMTDISKGKYFVMAGSMDSFHTPFDALFRLAVHITDSAETRLDRIHKREYESFGDRIMEGGDMYEEHQRFLDNSARYDSDGSPCMKTHKEWADTLHCKVIRLNGEEELNKSAEIIVKEFFSNTKMLAAEVK
ncbi:shikimate kinase [Kineothrix alysoides]|uniref:Shikimate kinase n=1 Tax=Kineothrix alysoides TaxID=1469948 RepID=A0A4V2QBC8_9FIRM|nr:AAA family ATPase [Kineothrix alysoides]TCL55932.1 shikimate kinase [Kineothrix alysoides]